MAALIKTKFCWWPMRLARHVDVKVGFVGGKDVTEPRMEFIGWVWWKTVVASNNINHGWVTFLDATPLKPRCSKCGQTLPHE